MYQKFINIMNANSKYNLPSQYQEVNYIQSSGSQYIDTGISFKTTYGIKCRAMFLSKQNTHADVYGFIVGPLSGGATVNWRIAGDSVSMFYSDDLTSSGAVGNYSFQFSNNTWYELAMNAERSGLVALNGTVFGPTGYFVGSYNVYLFASYNVYGGSIPYGMASLRVSSLIIYNDSGEEIANLVPCFRKSDMEVGMYDIIRNVFLTNAGSGNFTAGPNV